MIFRPDDSLGLAGSQRERAFSKGANVALPGKGMRWRWWRRGDHNKLVRRNSCLVIRSLSCMNYLRLGCPQCSLESICKEFWSELCQHFGCMKVILRNSRTSRNPPLEIYKLIKASPKNSSAPKGEVNEWKWSSRFDSAASSHWTLCSGAGHHMSYVMRLLPSSSGCSYLYGSHLWIEIADKNRGSSVTPTSRQRQDRVIPLRERWNTFQPSAYVYHFFIVS